MLKTRIFLLPLLLVACGGSEDLGQQSDEQLSPTPPTVAFNGDWSITRTGSFEVGQQLNVRYEAARLNDCRGDRNGQPAWSITAHWSFNGRAPQSATIAGFNPNGGGIANGNITVALSEAGDLAFWFEITSAFGCQAWDSNYGRNFHFNISNGPDGTIRFARDWSETVSGTLRRGGTILIDYDLARLPNCRQTYSGFATWDVLAFYRFDGGRVTQAPLTTIVGMGRVQSPAQIDIPSGAQQLELWFNNTDRAGCVNWDSNFSENYRFRTN